MPDFSTMPEVFISNADLATAVSREVKLGRHCQLERTRNK
jgi:hypothetical protein